MRNIMVCRRTFIAVLAIGLLAAMSFTKGIDTSMAIMTIALGIAGANAAEASIKSKFQKPEA